MTDGRVRLHAITEGSTANGPGTRTVVHFQGCTIGCKGCFNTATWLSDGHGELHVVEDVVNQIVASNDDITISGGEPLEQRAALLHLLRRLRARSPHKTILLFTGLEPQALKDSGDLAILQKLGVDLVVAGPYDMGMDNTRDLRGSTNQEFLFLSDRMSIEDISTREVEVMIGPDGTISMTGFPTKTLTLALRRAGSK